MAKKKPAKDRPMTDGEHIARAIDTSLYSDKLFGRSRTEGNITEAIGDLANNAERIANAISEGSEGTDATGGHIRCLTSSMMGVTAGLVQIAHAIDNLASAVRQHKE